MKAFNDRALPFTVLGQVAAVDVLGVVAAAAPEAASTDWLSTPAVVGSATWRA
jgi:hypothetical protein